MKCANRIRVRLQRQYGCENPNIQYGKLLQAAAEVLGLEEIDEDKIDYGIKLVRMETDKIVFTLRNGEEKEWQRK